jgi:hypothetical protein
MWIFLTACFPDPTRFHESELREAFEDADTDIRSDFQVADKQLETNLRDEFEGADEALREEFEPINTLSPLPGLTPEAVTNPLRLG